MPDSIEKSITNVPVEPAFQPCRYFMLPGIDIDIEGATQQLKQKLEKHGINFIENPITHQSHSEDTNLEQLHINFKASDNQVEAHQLANKNLLILYKLDALTLQYTEETLYKEIFRQAITELTDPEPTRFMSRTPSRATTPVVPKLPIPSREMGEDQVGDYTSYVNRIPTLTKQPQIKATLETSPAVKLESFDKTTALAALCALDMIRTNSETTSICTYNDSENVATTNKLPTSFSLTPLFATTKPEEFPTTLALQDEKRRATSKTPTKMFNKLFRSGKKTPPTTPRPKTFLELVEQNHSESMEYANVNLMDWRLQGGYQRAELPFNIIARFTPKNTSPIFSNLTHAPLFFDFQVSETENTVTLYFNSEYFDKTSASYIQMHFLFIYQELLNNKELSFDKLPKTTKLELEALKRFNLSDSEIAATGDAPTTVIETLQKNAEKKPNVIAQVFGNESLTYQQLYQYSQNLAKRILAQHKDLDPFEDKKIREAIAKGEAVEAIGLIGPRSLEMQIGKYAILMAGFPVYSVDLNTPEGRIAETLKFTRLLVNYGQIPYSEAVTQKRSKLNITRENYLTSTTEDLPEVTPDQPSNLIYTSGSTGTPKGVVNVHAGTFNRLQWIYGMFPNMTFLKKTPGIFDVSVVEDYWPGRTVIAPPGSHQDPNQLIDLIIEHNVDIIHFVPSMMRLFLSAVEDLKKAHNNYIKKNNLSANESDQQQYPTKYNALKKQLKHIFTSGERLENYIAQSCYQLLGIKILNLYGPTEASVDVTLHEWNPDKQGAVPIGRPAPGCEIHILDQEYNPVGIECIGQIFIGGTQVAKMYNNMPDATQKKFIVHSVYGRLYATGDLGKFRINGSIDFKGRMDEQLKVNGVRIEPGEIEQLVKKAKRIISDTMSVMAGVKQAKVTTLKPSNSSEEKLVIYVILDDTQPKQQALDIIFEFLTDNLEPAKVPLKKAIVSAPIFQYFPSGKFNKYAMLTPFENIPTTPKPGQTPATANPRRNTERQQELTEQAIALFQSRTNDNWRKKHDTFPTAETLISLGGGSMDAISLSMDAHSIYNVNINPAEALHLTVDKFVALIMTPGDRLVISHYGKTPLQNYSGLSSNQEGLYTAYRNNPNNPAYNIPIAQRLPSGVDVSQDHLVKAIQVMIKRYDILRTNFKTGENSEIVQSVTPYDDNHPFEVKSMGLAEKELNGFLEQETQKPFRLEQDNLVRAFIINTDEATVVFFCIAHIVFDGISENFFLEEISQYYEMLQQGKLPTPALLRRQYLSYTRDQRNQQDTPREKHRLDKWKERLDEDPYKVNLRYDNPQPNPKSFLGGQTKATLTTEFVKGCNDLAVAHNSTMYALTLAIFNTLLYKLTKEQNILIGSGHSTRLNRHDQIGHFVNIVPAITKGLSGDMSFEDVLKKAADTAKTCLSDANTPYQQIAAELSKRFNPSALPEIMMVYGQKNRVLMIDGKPSAEIDVKINTAKFPLTLYIEETTIDNATLDAHQALKIWFEYNESYFDSKTIGVFLNYYLKIIEQVTTDPTISLDSIQMDDNPAVLKGPSKPLPHDQQTLVDGFMKTASCHPDTLALESDTEKYTYAELDELSDRWAIEINQRLDGKRQQHVALYTNRDPRFEIALLAILKSGNIAIPMDEDKTTDEVKDILTDSNAAMIISDSHLRAKLPELGDTKPIIFDQEEPSSHQDIDQLKAIKPKPEEIAQMIYTSGTTGKPNGVEVAHRSLCNMAIAQQQFITEPGTRVLHGFSQSFDGTTYTVFGCFFNAGTLVVTPKHEIYAGEPLLNTLSSKRIQFATLTPSLLSNTEPPAEPLSVLLLATAGEALPRETATAWRVRYNLYGPTEAAVWTTVEEVNPEGSLPPTIGHPIQNVNVAILNNAKNPCALHEPGEIYIAGDVLAQGYANRPELNEERFVTVNSERYFKTGDRAVLTPTGILHLGRGDNQVKLNGQRIELGEVEHLMRVTHDAIANAVAMITEVDGEKFLAAYLVLKQGEQMIDVCGELKDKLYAQGTKSLKIPGHFEQVKEIPTTLNGKVNTKALPGITKIFDGVVYKAPEKDSVEESIINIICEVSKIDPNKRKISIHHRPADVRIDSNNASRVSTELESRYGIELPVEKLIDGSRIAALANIIREKVEQKTSRGKDADKGNDSDTSASYDSDDFNQFARQFGGSDTSSDESSDYNSGSDENKQPKRRYTRS